ncbi:MAG TPA: hypothetical protein VL738_04030 [Dactylosporangium sp.]|jgi:hypothetical protein|nr:hypothetical protein [Dactylosporangium sp.]
MGELDAAALARQVVDVLREVGLEAVFPASGPDAGEPSGPAGAHVFINEARGGVVCVRWECSPALQARAGAVAGDERLTDADVQLDGRTRFAMCEAIERVLVVAGYRAGQNVDRVPPYVWVMS